MPFITDQDLLDYTTQIEEAKEQKRVANYAHTKALRDEKENTQKFKITTMILAILALLGVAGTTYFLSTQTKTSGNTKELSKNKTTITSLKQKVTTLEEKIQLFKENDTTGIATLLDAKSEEISTLQQTVEGLETQLTNVNSSTTAATTTNEESNTATTAATETLNDQIVYTIQVSAHEGKQLSLHSDSFANLKEIQAGGFYKYSLGNFASLEEAKQYRNELKKVGIPKTFIASYQYGKRLRIEEVN